MFAVEIQPNCTYEDFAENIRNLARLIDPEYAAAELDLQDELYRLGAQADDVTIPLDIVMSRLVWVAWRCGHMTGRQN